ncbi:AraC family transcriptional regulator [Cohnella sp. CFH 77786]|uniref:AraC family transcriptional regulator n=1 Tax=Cohnella sp. CFH 77786 TaxID=2662265 RepID=UPI001C609359|nr:AraC family transcriptional regulator [Cohnella sp. CFH 77786]
MDKRGLLEERRHGSLDFPVGFYRTEREAGEPILDSHWHAETEFLAVESGQAIFQIGLSSFEVRAGEALFIPGGELHGGYALHASACTYSALVFDLDWLMGGQDGVTTRFLKPLQRGELTLPLHWNQETQGGQAAYARIMTLIMEENNLDDPARELRVKGHLLLLFADFLGAGMVVRRDPWEASESGTPERIKQVITHMERHFGRKLAIGELAAIAGMSEGHFSRTFKTYVRKTPMEYLNAIRLRYAAEKLRQPGVTVAEAAMESGFDNFSYFSKMFRFVYRCTPSEYRKKDH